MNDEDFNNRCKELVLHGIDAELPFSLILSCLLVALVRLYIACPNHGKDAFMEVVSDIYDKEKARDFKRIE